MGQLSKVAKATGMVYDKTGVIYGVYRQYSFCVEETANAGIFSVHFWAVPTDPQGAQGLYPYLEQLKQTRKHIRHIAVDGNHILVQLRIFTGTEKNRLNIEDVLNNVAGYLGQNNFINGCNHCGKTEDLSLCQINGACVQLCGDCYHGAVNALSAEEQRAKLNTGNLGTGIVGALIGALIGGILWVLVAQLGYIVGIVGLILAVLALKGYELLGGKIDKAGIVATMVIIVAVLFLANYISLAWMIYSEFSSMYDITFFDAFRSLSEFLAFDDILIPFIRDLAVGYIFTAAASVPVIKGMYNKSNKRFSARRLGE